jgi:hypothetical protein
MSKNAKKAGKPSSKQELAPTTSDPTKIIIDKTDDEIKQSDIHKFIETLRHKSAEFDNDFLAVRQKYHECYKTEIDLHLQINETKQINQQVKNSRADVAEKLHPVITAIRAEIPTMISRKKFAMILSTTLRDVDGKKQADAQGLSISNLTPILKIYVAKFGNIFDTKTSGAKGEHTKERSRTYSIKVDDIELIDKTFELYHEAKANDVFSFIKIIIDESYNLQKIEIVTSDQESEESDE